MGKSAAQRQAEYRERNKEKCMARCEEWRRKNRDKVREDTKERDRLRAQMIADYKMARGCARCGYREHPHALEFDHLPGVAKVKNVSCMKNVSMERLLREIEKCQVICANCHAIETTNRRLEGKESQIKIARESQLALRLA